MILAATTSIVVIVHQEGGHFQNSYGIFTAKMTQSLYHGCITAFIFALIDMFLVCQGIKTWLRKLIFRLSLLEVISHLTIGMISTYLYHGTIENIVQASLLVISLYCIITMVTGKIFICNEGDEDALIEIEIADCSSYVFGVSGMLALLGFTSYYGFI